MMLFSSQTVSKTEPFDTPKNQTPSTPIDAIPSKVLLSMATVPMLIGLWGAQNLASFLQNLGEASEEVFRGERLPVLNFPHR